MAYQIFTLPKQVNLDSSVRALSGAKATFYLTGTSTPTNVYEDSGLTTPHASPVEADSAGVWPVIFMDPTVSYKVTITDFTGALIYTQDPANENTLAIVTADFIGRLLNPRTPAEVAAGVTPTNYAYAPGHALRYHATGTPGLSATNDTAALLSMFKVCIQGAQTGGASSCNGYIPAGTWLVNEGVLVFNSNFVDLPWPVIETAGHDAVFLKGAGFADAPILTITNGTATSTGGNFWRGGSLGGITFQTNRVSGSNSHGLALTGLWKIAFGYMKGVNLVGSLLHIPTATFSGDPDPNSVSLCTFEALDAQGGKNVLQNDNGVGWDSNKVRFVIANTCTAGGLIAGGQGNWYGDLSMENCSGGYAYDDQSALASRNSIDVAEIDGCQYGIRVNNGFQHRYTGIRINHRYQTSPNTSANYWPRVAIDITGLSSPNLESTRIQVIHRINSGGALKDLGVFCDFHGSNSTFSDVIVEQNLSNQSGIPLAQFTDNVFVRNLGLSTNAVVMRDGRRINDTRIAACSVLTGNATTSIPNGGFGGTGNIIALPTTSYDPYGLVNSNSEWVAPWTGRARFMANFSLTMASGTKTRMQIQELIINSIATTGSLVAGTGYTNGTYTGVQLIGGTGAGAVATIVVAGGVVTTVTITTAGSNYTVADVLSAVNQDIGGTGTGFSVNVATVTAVTVSSAALARAYYAPTANVQSYSIEGIIPVTKGYAYCLNADQNSGGAVAPTLVSGNYAPDVYMHVEMCTFP